MRDQSTKVEYILRMSGGPEKRLGTTRTICLDPWSPIRELISKVNKSKSLRKSWRRGRMNCESKKFYRLINYLKKRRRSGSWWRSVKKTVMLLLAKILLKVLVVIWVLILENRRFLKIPFNCLRLRRWRQLVIQLPIQRLLRTPQMNNHSIKIAVILISRSITWLKPLNQVVWALHLAKKLKNRIKKKKRMP